MSDPEHKKQHIETAYNSSPRLRACILQFLRRLPGKLNRISLCKHLYYMDGHFFQKFGRTITEFPYLHIEGSPQPVFFNEVID